MALDFGKKHGPVWASVNGALVTVAATAVLEATDQNEFWALGGGVALGGVAAGDAAARGLSRASMCWRAACWVGAGLWSTAVRFNEPHVFGDLHAWWYSPTNWIIGALGATAAAISGHTMASRRRQGQEAAVRQHLREQARRLDTREDRIADEWERRIARVCRIGDIKPVLGPWEPDPKNPTSGRQVQRPLVHRDGTPVVRVVRGVEVYAVEHWKDAQGRENGIGMTLEVVLPEGGSTWKSIDNYREELASDARLNTGCTVVVREGINRGTVLIDVTFKDVLDGRYPYPEDLSETSIRQDLALGFEGHGNHVGINMFSDNTTLAGEPDSGKSNATHVIGAGILRTTDAIMVDIDIAGGGLSREYVREWAFGDLPNPGVAACGPNAPLAYVLAFALRNIIDARKTGYSNIMSDGRVPVAHDLEHGGVPLIVLRVDEGGTLNKAGRAGQYIRTLAEDIGGTGRPSEVRVLFGGLRGVDDYIPHGLQQLSPNRLQMRTGALDDAQRYLGWNVKIDPHGIRHPGTGLVKRRQELHAIKYWFLNEEPRIRDVVRRTSARRPLLDPVSVEAANQPIPLPSDELIDFFEGKPGFFRDGDGDAWLQDYWTNRWELILPVMFPEWDPDNAAPRTAPGPRPKPAPSPRSASSSTSTARGGVMDLEQTAQQLRKADGELAESMAKLAEEVRAAEAEQKLADSAPPSQEDVEGFEVPDTVDEFLGAVAKAKGEPAPESDTSQRALTPAEKLLATLELIEENTPEGIRADGVIESLREGYGITASMQTVHGWLKRHLEDGMVGQPWGRGAGDPDSRKGRYVITDKGRELLRRHREGR